MLQVSDNLNEETVHLYWQQIDGYYPDKCREILFQVTTFQRELNMNPLYLSLCAYNL